jgi:membrane protease YdiL (CAAX protease family)
MSDETSAGPSDAAAPWRALLVFSAIAVGATTAIAILCHAKGWTVESPAWAILAPLAMWAPALARLVARVTVDRGFTGTLTLRRWGITGARVILEPLVLPLAVYAAAYTIAWSIGVVQFSPGAGKWKNGTQIAANLAINLSILAAFGTFTALGEELGWRGYLQPRLDAARVRFSVVAVWLVQLAYHLPLMVGAGYLGGSNLLGTLSLFAIADLPASFLFAWLAYRARSLWPAVFFHSFHNTISQWLFPKFFVGGSEDLLLGETGLLPVVGYVVIGTAVFLAMRRRGPSWQDLARSARPIM